MFFIKQVTYQCISTYCFHQGLFKKTSCYLYMTDTSCEAVIYYTATGQYTQTKKQHSGAEGMWRDKMAPVCVACSLSL